MRILALIILVSFASRAHGETSALEGMPRITQYSKNEIVVHQGDKIELEATVLGRDVATKWIRNDEVVCLETKCVIDTAKWGLGDQKLVLVAFNNVGSQFVRYLIRVLVRTPEVNTTVVKPPLVRENQNIESLKADDFNVRVVSGVGYAYTRAKVQVIGNTARILSWKERLRTHPEGVLRFGRDGIEEHFLLHESIASLVVSPTGRRGVLLLKGKLRSRQLNNQEANWSIIVSDYVQIDVDGKGDVIVEQDDSQRGRFLVTVLRGFARVHHTLYDDTGKPISRKEVVVSPGSAVGFRRSLPPNERLAPDIKSVGETVSLSAPKYTGQESFRPELETAMSFQGDMAKAVKVASDLLAKDDAPGALEILLPYAAKAPVSFGVALNLGKSLARLFLFKEATKYLLLARKVDKKSPFPSFELGMMAIHQQEWEKAQSELDEADMDNFPDEQQIAYYQGIAAYRLGKKLASRNAFTVAVWEGTHASLTDSSREFLDHIEEDRTLKMKFYGGGGSDTNPLRLSETAELPTGIEARGSRFYEVGAGIDYDAFHDEGAYARIGFDIKRTAFSQASLKELAKVDQSLFFRIGVALDEGSRVPAARLILMPTVGTTILGSERADDFIATDVALEFPKAFCQPQLLFHSTLHLDPLPAQEDLIDVNTGESQTVATERTKRWTEYGFRLCPLLGGRHFLGVDFYYSTLNMRNSDLYTENFKGQGGVLRNHFSIFKRLALVGELGYKTRAYAISMDARADKQLTIDETLRWYLSPAFHAGLFGTYEKNTSTRESSTFLRRVFGLRLGLEL